MTVIRTIFPMAFPYQPCLRCLAPLDIAGPDTLHEFDADGKPLGYRHDDCEEPEWDS
jgi:hypothetical protein